jgi:hypothetical protein
MRAAAIAISRVFIVNLCIEWTLVGLGLSFTRENKLLILLVYRGRAWLLPSSKRVTPQCPLFFDYCIAKNQNKPGKKTKL